MMQQPIQATSSDKDVETGNVSKEGLYPSPPPAYTLQDTAHSAPNTSNTPSVGANYYGNYNPNYATNYTIPSSHEKTIGTTYVQPVPIQIENLRCAAIFVLIFCIIPCINTLILLCCVVPVMLQMWPKIHLCEAAIRNGDHIAAAEAYQIAKRAVWLSFIVGVFAWIVSIGLTIVVLNMYGWL